MLRMFRYYYFRYTVTKCHWHVPFSAVCSRLPALAQDLQPAPRRAALGHSDRDGHYYRHWENESSHTLSDRHLMIYKCIIIVCFIIHSRGGENHLILWSRVLRSVCTVCRSLIIGAGPETLTWPKEIAEPVWARAGRQGQGRYLSDKLGPGTAMLDIMAGLFINFYPVRDGITS